MAYNRLEKILLSKEGDFGNLALAQKPIESLFEGPQNFSAILTQEIVKIKQKAEKDGYEKAIADINNFTKDKIEKYIYNISFIVGLVQYLTINEVKKDIKVIDSRARFCFDTEWIDIVFIIEADADDEILFSNLLSNIQHVVFQNQNLIVEMLYINEKSREVDYSALKNDYPFVVKPAEIKL